MTDINALLRENIRSLIPYSSARDEYKGEEAVFMDANENPYNNTVNRYPDPLQVKLKSKISGIKNIPAENIFLGNGSDEAIDLLIRAFCEPGVDNVLAIKPTYGMYKVCADVNGVEYRESLLNDAYQVNVSHLLGLSDAHSKIMFLCSPNNPTSNSLHASDILHLIEHFNGLVIVDEAYIDFSSSPSLVQKLPGFSNLVILQTFSKAWGMAGIRLGLAFACAEIIRVLNRIKYPYNVNVLTQRTALDHLSQQGKMQSWVQQILQQREFLRQELGKTELVMNILPSEANFLMVRFEEARAVFDFLMERKIIVRDRSRVPLCAGYLRITVGTPEENTLLINTLKKYKSPQA
jgi:histidinol-phosphate aminotransferase